MMAIARLGGDAYGASVRREIEDRTGRPVSIGALYATLARLGDKGLLDFEEVDPQPGERGRMDHSMTMLRRMMDGLEPLGSTERQR